jgi:hypothetical protein
VQIEIQLPPVFVLMIEYLILMTGEISMKIKAGIGLFLVSLMVLGMFLALPTTQVQADTLSILRFGTMVGVPKAFTAGQNPIRGINGGGLPWVISGAQGSLSASGKLSVRVTGLVLDPKDPTVISNGLAGQNPSASFRAIVSCQTADGGVMNVMTDPFPAKTGLASEGGGNARVVTTVTLPKPCIAPIIFITNPAGAWFAATGF